MSPEYIRLARELKSVTDRAKPKVKVNDRKHYWSQRALGRRKMKAQRLINDGWEQFKNYVARKAKKHGVKWHTYYTRLNRSGFKEVEIKRLNSRVVLVKERT